MLIMREYKKNEIDEIKQLLIEEEIEDIILDGIIYIMKEDDLLVGVCKINIENNNGELKYIVISSKKTGENLGEGLLKAIFNKLDKDGLEKIYFNKENSYLGKKGFQSKNDKLKLDLSEFFKAGCKCDCTGEENEI